MVRLLWLIVWKVSVSKQKQCSITHSEKGFRPVLTINKMDRCFLQLQVDGEEAYQTFRRVIANANVIGDVQVYPEKGLDCMVGLLLSLTLP